MPDLACAYISSAPSVISATSSLWRFIIAENSALCSALTAFISNDFCNAFTALSAISLRLVSGILSYPRKPVSVRIIKSTYVAPLTVMPRGETDTLPSLCALTASANAIALPSLYLIGNNFVRR